MPSGSHRKNVGAIVGGTMGGLAAVALAVVAFLFWRRGGQKRENSSGEVIVVLKSESKPSLDSMRPGEGRTQNTVPTPFGPDWQAIYHATHFGGEIPTFPPSSDGTQPQQPLSSKQALARQQRQRELELQMRHLQDEMVALGPEPEQRLSASLQLDRSEDLQQIEMMKQQIALLQAQQRSSWAQGLTDEPPPGYTAAAVASRVATPEHTEAP